MSDRPYELAVVGAGATGSELAWRVAETGRRVLLVTTSLDTIFAAASERPRADAREGTLQHELRDRLTVRDDGTVGAWELHAAAKGWLETVPSLTVLQSSVDALVVDGDGAVRGLDTWEGVPRRADRVALCVGSFLRARLLRGASEEHAGRPGEMAYDELADDLRARGVPLRPCRWNGPADEGAPDENRWTVHFERLDRAGLDGFAVRTVHGLYAAGVCRHGPLTYPGAARDGADLAHLVLDQMRLGEP
ncbi:MAG: FAD-dependent oxidoreductase [Trueperaceae bacterium]